MVKATTTGARGGEKLQQLWKRVRGVVFAAGVMALAAGAPSRSSVLAATFVLRGLAACSSPLPGTIGAQLGRKADGRLFVRGVPPGQGADKAGLMVDDEVIAIEGRPVRELSQDDIKKAVRGDMGSSFTVTIERDGQRRDVKIERSPLLPATTEKR